MLLEDWLKTEIWIYYVYYQKALQYLLLSPLKKEFIVLKNI